MTLAPHPPRRPALLRIPREQPGYIRAECSNGNTYFAARILPYRGRKWRTVVGMWRTGTREPDREVHPRELPACIRAYFAAHLLPAPTEPSTR